MAAEQLTGRNNVHTRSRTNRSKHRAHRTTLTNVLVVLAILVQHTDADGILARLVRSTLGPGWWERSACAGASCSLSLACWAHGGTPRGAPSCGPAWLLSCCYGEEEEDNFIHKPPQVAVFKADNGPLEVGGSWNRPPQTSLFRRRIDDDYDEETDCGVAGGTERLQKRIIGGRAAQMAEFPWQAHIRIGDFQCGGVLVSRWFVATAAHCVQRARTRDINVWLGALDTRAQAPPADKHKVSQKLVHPLFRFRVTQPDRFDLALLRLSRPAALTSQVLPVCLPPAAPSLDGDRLQVLGQEWKDGLAGQTALVAGWGSTGRGGAPRGTHHLRSAIVPILSTEECIRWHKSKQISVEIHMEMICAGHSDGHQDACLGDSGGPLVVMQDGRYYLVGITSAGFGCGQDHQPGIYHSVLVTSPWIRRVIWR